MPGEGALLAPDWVPWVDRLEEYRVAQAALAAQPGGELIDDDEMDDDLDDLEDDDSDDSDDGIDDDGIDFEGALLPDDVSASGPPLDAVDEQDEAEPESDDAGPEQPDQS
jgi:hypothetical protein